MVACFPREQLAVTSPGYYLRVWLAHMTLLPCLRALLAPIALLAAPIASLRPPHVPLPHPPPRACW